ncbi:MAG: electron transfer flavoprotein subunit alpha/FixB family protein [Candidatus Kapabacteria bacterium]|nr:electron transfer flavoprotein subunit alpha/FixB family protein [Candidatus Kapabacteria bacterium]
MSKGILVLADHTKEVITDVSYEMLGIGRKLADSMNQPLYSLIIGDGAEKFASGFGIADKVFVVADKKIEIAIPELIVQILKKIVTENDISLILVAGTNISSGVGPLLAAKLDYRFIHFCKNLIYENGELMATSQLFGGKIFSETVLNDCKGIFSILPGSFPAEAGKASRFPEIIDIPHPDDGLKIKFKAFIEPEAGDVDVTKESILVSVGRGIGSSDNISIADELVEIIGGAVCASRPIIDQGWLPLSRQIGKSGMIVKPKLYMALGISGAPEHIEGMKDAELIIAVNKDSAAPIFNVAQYGICADIDDIVPMLIDKLKERK